ncbi:hypothetical protein K9M78_08670 [Candidatus Bipolaricaulota bacterium]|nr:hypothetical protein [Candidatus Bipolaricaulota bacterium]
MTKKFLAVTLVLVLAAGFAAVAQDEERPLTGTWENTLYLNPTEPELVDLVEFYSTVEGTYTSGGLTFTGEADLAYDNTYDYDGLTDLELGVSTSVGLLDLSSTVNFNTQTPGLEYWTSSASLTLGGVSITDTFVLQDTSDNPNVNNGFGAGMDLSFSGETPGGVSVTVNNYFGMEPLVDTSLRSARLDWGYATVGLITGTDYGYGSIPYYSGYAIVDDHGSVQTASSDYSPSSLQYVGSKLTLENLSLGCCDFSNETLFSEMNGFEYTLFEFTIESTSLPLTLDGALKFTPQTKSISLTPSIDTGWACFTVYTDLSGVLGNDGPSMTGDTINGLEIEGFAITGVELGHVTFSSYTALGSNTLYTLEGYNFYPHGTYDELFRIEKLDKYPLDFTLDTYFDMSNSQGIFDLALFAGSMAYEIDEEFTIGTGVEVEPVGGLQEFSFTFDYSF